MNYYMNVMGTSIRVRCIPSNRKICVQKKLILTIIFAFSDKSSLFKRRKIRLYISKSTNPYHNIKHRL